MIFEIGKRYQINHDKKLKYPGKCGRCVGVTAEGFGLIRLDDSDTGEGEVICLLFTSEVIPVEEIQIELFEEVSI